MLDTQAPTKVLGIRTSVCCAQVVLYPSVVVSPSLPLARCVELCRRAGKFLQVSTILILQQGLLLQKNRRLL